MKKIAKIIAIILGALVLLLSAYAAFVVLSYSRLGDTPLTAEHRAEEDTLSLEKTYSLTTYNVGFGAYQQDFTCVLDHAYVEDGSGGWTRVCGKNLKAFSKADAERNTNGAVGTVAALEPDFLFFQEIDVKSDRCYGIDQTAVAKEALPLYDSVYCSDFHMPFLAYPLNDMMGSVEAGLLTLSRYTVSSAERRELPVSDKLVSKLFDLDRCFSATYVDVENGKQLVLVNLHMSAYDEGGVIRAAQREELYSFLAEEYAKGNYVIAAGDYNHDLLTNNPAYPAYTEENLPFADRMTEKLPDNLVLFFDENGEAGLPEGFTMVAADNDPTCRPAAISWQPGFSYIRVLDGFLVSDNVTVVSCENIVTMTEAASGFAYSDHEPAYLRFTLK